MTPATIEAVQRMHRCHAHRGPDAEGSWASDVDTRELGCALAHRRLAIIDLSPDASQPMVDPETGNVIIFNGEVYNYRALRTELSGEDFRTRSDTEVLLKAYGRWGEACFERLRGMFTVVIWDAKRRVAVAARDRLGIKPLYWARVRHRAGDVILLASELRSILASDLVERRIDPAGLASYVWNGFVVGPGTIARDIHLLPQGCLAVIDPARPDVRPQPFWRLPAAGSDGSEAELEAALADAVELRLISDVPLGIFLSGGIDSSAVTALAVRRSNTQVATFNIAFDEPEYDESMHARAVATALGTDHREVRLTPERFRAELPRAMESLDQPTFDAINTWFVSAAVREAGLTVALAGTGGDELFGGYRSFADVPRAAAVAKRLRVLPEGTLRAMAAAALLVKHGRRRGAVPPQTRWGKLGDVLAGRGDLLAAYQGAYALYTQDFQRRLLGDEGAAAGVRHGLPAKRAAELAEMINGQPPLHAVAMLELSCFIGERLLRDTDCASMAVALEVRVPLLDHIVVKQAARLPAAARFEPLGRKTMLRRAALGDLDPALFERPKRGFVLPIERWAREELAGEVEHTLLDEAACAAAGLHPPAVRDLWNSFTQGAPGLYWSRIWAIHTLLWWCRRHEVTM